MRGSGSLEPDQSENHSRAMSLSHQVDSAGETGHEIGVAKSVSAQDPDPSMFLEEGTRLRGLHNLMNMGGNTGAQSPPPELAWWRVWEQRGDGSSWVAHPHVPFVHSVAARNQSPFPSQLGAAAQYLPINFTPDLAGSLVGQPWTFHLYTYPRIPRNPIKGVAHIPSSVSTSRLLDCLSGSTELKHCRPSYELRIQYY